RLVYPLMMQQERSLLDNFIHLRQSWQEKWHYLQLRPQLRFINVLQVLSLPQGPYSSRLVYPLMTLQESSNWVVIDVPFLNNELPELHPDKKLRQSVKKMAFGTEETCSAGDF
ncbi:hypothetical protein ACJX0J_007944, partial [Zea mays]